MFDSRNADMVSSEIAFEEVSCSIGDYRTTNLAVVALEQQEISLTWSSRGRHPEVVCLEPHPRPLIEEGHLACR